MKNTDLTFHRLDRMLAQELRQQCTDQLVIGGLAAYVTQRWQQEAEADAVSDEERGMVTQAATALAHYSEQTAEQRQEAITACRSLLADLMRSAADRPPAPPPPAAEPATTSPGAPATAPAVSSSDPRQAQAGRAPRQASAPRAFGLEAPVTTVPGINVGFAAKLARLGVHTVRDLLYMFPHRYNDFSTMKRIADLEIGAVETIVGTIADVQNITGRANRVRTEAIVNDETGAVKVVWFNQPYLASQFRRGQPIVLSGKVDIYLGRKVLESPEHETLDTEDLLHTGRLAPVYPLTEGIGARWMRRLQKRVVDRWAGQAPDFLPPEVIEATQLPGLPDSIAQMHFPDNAERLERARRRLAFDELFVIQVGLMRRRRQWQQGIVGTPLTVDHAWLDELKAALPFSLTSAQERCLQVILHDITLSRPMARLLQGDVGSGKTVVALLAMLVAVGNGYQAAMMAPTEILARQHFKTLTSLLVGIAAKSAPSPELAIIEHQIAANDLPDLLHVPGLPGRPNGVRLARLVGSLSDSSKQAVRDSLAAGNVDIAVGTHALIEGSVSFERLAFAAIDEQHRFGVMQRAALRQKGYNPHVLVMTATPIPRTLALTMYGDLDISTIDELPPGRQVVKTRWLEPRDRERAYTFIRKQVQEGHQAFVICPLVEESEALEAKAAVEEYDRLHTDVFPDLRIGLVHGRLKGSEKDDTMARFGRGELDILVATAVVEVGIDVPNATVMLIEGANRFGLAQLHQFRGRVGRGAAQSYCILLATESRVTEDNPRLLAVESTHDGFKLAEIDLEIRGMGEFFGTRQSGLPDLRVARLSDVVLLELARTQAEALFERDPDLVQPDNQRLVQRLHQAWRQPSGEGDVS